tara:strand:- start:514 stop:723 length:210 start_codon:yes stop_codon:yes gene_type:complete
MIYISLTIIFIVFFLIILHAYELLTKENNELIKNLDSYAEKKEAEQFKPQIQESSRVKGKAYKKEKANV